MHINMQLNDFADFLFIKNTNNIPIELSITTLNDNRDIFCFFLDLLCKGLVLLFGTDNKVEIENLTDADFALIRKKMQLVGVDVSLDIRQNESNKRLGLIFDDTLKSNLEDYEFSILADKRVYVIKFSWFNPECHRQCHSSLTFRP